MELVDMNSLGLFDFLNFIRSSRIYLRPYFGFIFRDNEVQLFQI
jgi:hypothetical protein